MSPRRAMTDYEWSQECAYIAVTTNKRGKVKEMNFDKATFVRYCRMMYVRAVAEGKYDSATFIQHCIDDLSKP